MSRSEPMKVFLVCVWFARGGLCCRVQGGSGSSRYRAAILDATFAMLPMSKAHACTSLMRVMAPSILLIHGSGAENRRVAAAFSGAFDERLSCDLHRSSWKRSVGFRSPGGDMTPIPEWRFVLAFLRELGIERATVLGHSTGGQIA